MNRGGRVIFVVLSMALASVSIGSEQSAAHDSTPKPSGQSEAPVRAKKFNAGIEAKIASLERNGRRIAATITLYNKGTQTVHLILAGPAPTVVAAGRLADFRGYSGGITACPSLLQHTGPACMGKVKGAQAADLQQFTVIEPGRDISFAFEFLSHEVSKAPLLGLSATLIYRTSAGARADATLTDDEKRAELNTMNLSFPPSPVIDLK